MVITKITLKNFQTHKQLTLELENFTAIVGESSAGKSSILRALSWLFYGDWDGTYPNDPEQDTAVAIQLTNGTIWGRFRKGRRNWAMCRRPGEKPIVYQDFGNVIPGILEEINVRDIKIGNHKVNLNFSMQDDPIFMIHETKPTKAQWIGRLYGAHIINAMLSLMSKDKRRIESRKKSTEDEESRLSVELEKYDGLEEETQSIERAGNLIKRLSSMTDCQLSLRDMMQDMEAIKIGRLILEADTNSIRFNIERLGKLVDARDDNIEVKREELLLRDNWYLKADTDEISAEIKLLESAKARLKEYGQLSNKLQEAKVELKTATAGIKKASLVLKKLRADIKKSLFDGGKCPLCRSKPKKLNMTTITSNLKELVRS